MINKNLVVINTANRPWTVIDSECLRSLFSEYRYFELFFSTSCYAFERSENDQDQSVKECLDEDYLIESLRQVSPSIIYLRVSPHTRSEYLCSRIRNDFPRSKLIIEFYDISSHFDNETLDYISGFNSDKIHKAIEGCRIAFNEADCLVFKMGGKGFDKWAKTDVKSPYVTYFPSVKEPILSRKLMASNFRNVLYAGSASAREFNEGFGSVPGANIIRYLDVLSRCDSVNLTIVNAAHWHESENNSSKIKNLLEWCSSKERVSYLRTMPRVDLVKKASDFQIGICCSHYKEDKVMDVTRFGIPNRVSTYVEAGLPVLVDNRFEYIADLIETFDAGAVIPAGDFDYFSSKVLEMDLLKASRGVFHLASYMIDENKKSLAKVKRISETL